MEMDTSTQTAIDQYRNINPYSREGKERRRALVGKFRHVLLQMLREGWSTAKIGAVTGLHPESIRRIVGHADYSDARRGIAAPNGNGRRDPRPLACIRDTVTVTCRGQGCQVRDACEKFHNYQLRRRQVEAEQQGEMLWKNGRKNSALTQPDG